MQFPLKYKCLNQNEFEAGDYKIVPIRYEDRMEIMKWRNEQIFHLRQNNVLSEDDQENYFGSVIKDLFFENKPSQLIFSFLKKNVCVGYGGLVHINWIDKHAEISFIMNTDLETKNFQIYWTKFLNIIERVAFDKLYFHKIFTYAFDVRPNLYDILEKSDFNLEARLKDHCKFSNKFIDVVIHSKFNNYK